MEADEIYITYVLLCLNVEIYALHMYFVDSTGETPDHKWIHICGFFEIKSLFMALNIGNETCFVSNTHHTNYKMFCCIKIKGLSVKYHNHVNVTILALLITYGTCASDRKRSSGGVDICLPPVFMTSFLVSDDTKPGSMMSIDSISSDCRRCFKSKDNRSSS